MKKKLLSVILIIIGLIVGAAGVMIAIMKKTPLWQYVTNKEEFEGRDGMLLGSGIVVGVIGVALIVVAIVLFVKARDEVAVREGKSKGGGLSERYFMWPFCLLFFGIWVALFFFGMMIPQSAVEGTVAFVAEHWLAFVIPFGAYTLIHFLFCAKYTVGYHGYDKALFDSYILNGDSINPLTMLALNFAGAVNWGPLAFSRDDDIRYGRRRTTLIMFLSKLALTFSGLMLGSIMFVSLAVYKHPFDMELVKFMICPAILYLGANLETLFYGMLTLLPFIEVSKVRETTYYSDGSRTSRDRTTSNIFIVMLGSLLFFSLYQGMWWLFYTALVSRLIVDKRDFG